MKRNSRKKVKGSQVRLRTWSHAQAEAARPYIASIVQSMRELFLEVIRWGDEAKRLAQHEGRPDRAMLIARTDAQHALDEARSRFEDAEDELNELDVYSLDPVQGLALIPFIRDEQLAWFVFDLFDPAPLRFWRYQEDSLDTRRPVQ